MMGETRRVLWLLSILSCALVGITAHADVLVMKSGKRWEGRVTETETHYSLQLPDGGTVGFPKSAVAEVIISELPKQELAAGDVAPAIPAAQPWQRDAGAFRRVVAEALEDVAPRAPGDMAAENLGKAALGPLEGKEVCWRISYMGLRGGMVAFQGSSPVQRSGTFLGETASFVTLLVAPSPRSVAAWRALPPGRPVWCYARISGFLLSTRWTASNRFAGWLPIATLADARPVGEGEAQRLLSLWAGPEDGDPGQLAAVGTAVGSPDGSEPGAGGADAEAEITRLRALAKELRACSARRAKAHVMWSVARVKEGADSTAYAAAEDDMEKLRAEEERLRELFVAGGGSLWRNIPVLVRPMPAQPDAVLGEGYRVWLAGIRMGLTPAQVGEWYRTAQDGGPYRLVCYLPDSGDSRPVVVAELFAASEVAQFGLGLANLLQGQNSACVAFHYPGAGRLAALPSCFNVPLARLPGSSRMAFAVRAVYADYSVGSLSAYLDEVHRTVIVSPDPTRVPVFGFSEALTTGVGVEGGGQLQVSAKTRRILGDRMVKLLIVAVVATAGVRVDGTVHDGGRVLFALDREGTSAICPMPSVPRVGSLFYPTTLRQRRR